MDELSKTSDRESKRGRAYIGTSGWSYEHWQGIFYPERLPQKDRFTYFAEHIPTVELNAVVLLAGLAA
jgi:hypothetical protein